MTLLLASAALGGVVAPCTFSAPLGEGLEGPSPVVSALVTVTVPPGNSGSLDFAFGFNTASIEYSKNGGGFVLVNNGDDVIFANGDTLQMRVVGTLGQTAGVDVSDNHTATLIDTFSGAIDS